MMRTLQRTNLRKFTKNILPLVTSVKSISVRNRTHPSPLYLKWKLKDHRQYENEELGRAKTPMLSEFLKYVPKKVDYQNALVKELNFSEEEAKSTVDLNLLNQREYDEFSKIIQVMKKYNIKCDEFKRNTHIIWLSGAEEVEQVLTLLTSTLNISAEVALPLTEIMDEMTVFLEKMHPMDLECFQRSRINFLSEVMSVTPYIISCWIAEYPFLLKFPSERMKRTLPEVLEVVPMELVLANPSFLKYSCEFLLTRVEMCQRMGKDKRFARPWMLRVDLHELERALLASGYRERVECERECGILESSKWSEFVAELLDSDPEFIQFFLEAVFFIRRKPVALKRIIHMADIFDEMGYPRKLITLSPYIFVLSNQAVIRRLTLMKKLGLSPDDLHDVTATYSRGWKDFERAVQIIIESKNKSSSDEVCSAGVLKCFS